MAGLIYTVCGKLVREEGEAREVSQSAGCQLRCCETKKVRIWRLDDVGCVVDISSDKATKVFRSLEIFSSIMGITETYNE